MSSAWVSPPKLPCCSVLVAKTRQTPPCPQGTAQFPAVQASAPSQISQVCPVLPQAVSLPPGWQEPSLAQQPVGQGSSTEQMVQVRSTQIGAEAGQASAQAPLAALQQVSLGHSSGSALHGAQVLLTQTGSVPEQSSLWQHSTHAPLQQIAPLPQAVRFGSGQQAPTWFSRAHASQSPLHAVSQQTPSTQKPEAHCPPWTQGWPSSPSPTQWCAALQKAPATQSLSSPQVVAQVSPSQST
jgi:hypothetical protein